ncbi:MAG: cupin domain-containing protein [Candidatus Wallbacteria bacterium]|nr:cupin domain-containing protein [Candidatus Wallbacteria bacterium]
MSADGAREGAPPPAPSSGRLDPGKPVRLEQELDYVAGAIVSRTLAKARGGTLTLFAFDAGQGLSEHTSPFEAFVQVLDGSALVTIAGKASTVAAGEIIALPANVPHAVHASVRFKMLLSMVRD